MDKTKRIIVLGGGFGGVFTAHYLEKLFKHHSDYEIVLVSRENYFTYQPMMAEIIGGSVGVLDTVSALRSLLKRTHIYVREISSIDTTDQTVILSPNFSHTNLILHYDHLVLAFGNVTDFRTSSGGLHEHALGFKTLSDAIRLRNRLIDVIEAAATEESPSIRKQLLTFVVGGGGFSGVEVVAEINDFVRRLVKKYPTLKNETIQVTLLHSKGLLMDRELSESLSRYSEKILRKRGVDIRCNTKLVTATPYEAILEGGERIPSSTVVSTVPSTPNTLIESLSLAQKHGRILTDTTLLAPGTNNVWALGDCALVPSPNGEGTCPPTAQFAVREAKTLAKNIHASCMELPLKTFSFKSLGMMAALGHRRAVAELFGFIKLSGLSAWLLWRAIYWFKLPGFSRKIKVALSWMLEMIFPAEAVQLKLQTHEGMTHLHYAADEIVFHAGDIGDYLYIIVSGEVEILKIISGKESRIATLKTGEYFGEMALLNQKSRSATVRCTKDTELIAMKKHDFQVLITNFGDLKEHFKKTEKERHETNRSRLNKELNIDDIGDLLHPPSNDSSSKKHHSG